MAKLVPVPNRETLVRRILRAYDSADDSTLETGREWYPIAYKHCKALANESGYTVETIAAVVAVLSPRVRWHENIADATEMVLTSIDPDAGEYPRTLRALGSNISKAAFILNGEEPENVVSGPKVGPFWHAILGDEDALVVDSWVMKVCRIDRDSPTPRVWREIHAAYRIAAKRRGESIRSMQSITWIVTRGSAF